MNEINSIVFGIDIGGTKVTCCGFSAGDVGSYHFKSPQLMVTFPFQPGQVGLSAVLLKIRDWINSVCLDESGLPYPILGVGCPGTFKKGFILPGTATQLETVSGEWNGVLISQFILSILPQFESVFVTNDAIMQALGGVRSLGLTFAKNGIFIGPGTGLGGARIFCTDDGILDRIEPLSLSELELDGFPAESRISGLAFTQKMGFTPKEAVDSQMLWINSIAFVAEMGAYLGQLIRQLSDIYEMDWVLIGGSLGTQPPFSTVLLSAAKAVMMRAPQLMVDMRRLPHPDWAACWGAAESAYHLKDMK